MNLTEAINTFDFRTVQARWRAVSPERVEEMYRWAEQVVDKAGHHTNAQWFMTGFYAGMVSAAEIINRTCEEPGGEGE